MRKNDKGVSPETIKALLDYRPEDGALIWKVKPRRNTNAGDVAGHHKADGSVAIRIDGVRTARARLVWALHRGFYPAARIKHINGIPGDDRIENLTLSVAGKTKKNRPDCPGAYADPTGRYFRATIARGGRLEYLGVFRTPEEASATYKRAHVELYGSRSPFFTLGDDK